MKVRGAALQGGLAAAGLLAAWAVWQKAPTTSASEVVVFDANNKQLERMRYEDDAKFLELFRGENDTLWVKHGGKARPAPQAALSAADAGAAVASASVDAGPAIATAPAAPVVQKERLQKGGETALKLFEKLAPLKAARSLGKLPAAKLKELGLEGSTRTFALVAGGKSTRFTVGSPQSMGSLYLRGEDGEVWLMAATFTTDLTGDAGRLVDRRLHTFDRDSFDRLVLKAGEKVREFAAASKPAPGPAVELTPRDAQGKPDEFAKNWHEKLWGLTPVDVLGQGESPTEGAPKVSLRVEYLKGSTLTGFLEIGEAGSTIYARSENTLGWAKLPLSAADLTKDGAKIVSQ